MKFIIDAQLPFALAKLLLSKQLDVIHTDHLPNKERSGDEEIRKISEKENRIVITKDLDFLDSYYIKGIPRRLLLVTTGNINNKRLLSIFESNLEMILELFLTYTFVELDNYELIGHE